ncbi:unnamed protein product [Somion occarium]|uniref:F-box domain-containing protein n=1 Tax=Somion occarium TaxID=3059160 RepID=A0ABP1EBL6_9APHY
MGFTQLPVELVFYILELINSGYGCCHDEFSPHSKYEGHVGTYRDVAAFARVSSAYKDAAYNVLYHTLPAIAPEFLASATSDTLKFIRSINMDLRLASASDLYFTASTRLQNVVHYHFILTCDHISNAIDLMRGMSSVRHLEITFIPSNSHLSRECGTLHFPFLAELSFHSFPAAAIPEVFLDILKVHAPQLRRLTLSLHGEVDPQLSNVFKGLSWPLLEHLEVDAITAVIIDALRMAKNIRSFKCSQDTPGVVSLPDDILPRLEIVQTPPKQIASFFATQRQIRIVILNISHFNFSGTLNNLMRVPSESVRTLTFDCSLCERFIACNITPIWHHSIMPGVEMLTFNFRTTWPVKYKQLTKFGDLYLSRFPSLRQLVISRGIDYVICRRRTVARAQFQQRVLEKWLQNCPNLQKVTFYDDPECAEWIVRDGQWVLL